MKEKRTLSSALFNFDSHVNHNKMDAKKTKEKVFYDKNQVKLAVEALSAHVKEKSQVKKKDELFESDELLWLVVGVTKIPPVQRKPVKIPLPHSFDDNREVCFITSKTSQSVKELLRKNDVTSITKVIALTKLRKEYKTYELKRQLLSAYDVILCEENIYPFVLKSFGKLCTKKRKEPIPVRLRYENIKQEINNCINSTLLRIGRGACMALKIGSFTNNSKKELCENLAHTMAAVARKLPGGSKNIKSMQVKSANSISLPVYQCNPLLSTGKIDVPVEPVRKRRKVKLSLDDSDEEELVDIKEKNQNVNGPNVTEQSFEENVENDGPEIVRKGERYFKKIASENESTGDEDVKRKAESNLPDKEDNAGKTVGKSEPETISNNRNTTKKKSKSKSEAVPAKGSNEMEDRESESDGIDEKSEISSKTQKSSKKKTRPDDAYVSTKVNREEKEKKEAEEATNVNGELQEVKRTKKIPSKKTRVTRKKETATVTETGGATSKPTLEYGSDNTQTPLIRDDVKSAQPSAKKPTPDTCTKSPGKTDESERSEVVSKDNPETSKTNIETEQSSSATDTEKENRVSRRKSRKPVVETEKKITPERKRGLRSYQKNKAK